MMKKGITTYHIHTKLKRVQREQIKQLYNNVNFQMQKWSKVVNPDRDTHKFGFFLHLTVHKYAAKIVKDKRLKIPNPAY
jgi:N-glycosylase/DNA lyase